MMTVTNQPQRQQQPPSNQLSEEELEKKEQRKEFYKKALKFTLSQLGLLVIIILYAVAGGFIFQHLEATNEKDQCIQAMDQYNPMENATVYKMWTISSSFRSIDDAPYAMAAFHTQLSQFRDQILALGYTGINCTIMGEPDGPPYSWNYAGSLLFSTTIFTTVGYGNIAPKTFWGRLVCIAYAVLGIPLMLLFLANIGEIMANCFRYVYLNVCCCGFMKRKDTTQLDQLPQPNPSNSMDAWQEKFRAQQAAAAAGRPTVVDGDNEDDEDVNEEEEISVPLTVSLGLIAIYLFVGALLFSVWIDLSPLDAAYFCFITISTIGFGDIVPGTQSLNTLSGQLQMVGTAVYMVFGMAILSMAFNLIQDEIIAKFRWLGEKLGIYKPDADDMEEDGATAAATAGKQPINRDDAPLQGRQPMVHPGGGGGGGGPWMDQNPMAGGGKQSSLPPPFYSSAKGGMVAGNRNYPPPPPGGYVP